MLGIKDVEVESRRVLIRADLNVPIENGAVASAERISAALPTIRHALERGAAVQVMSHLGRPQEGSADPEFSLRPVAARLQQELGAKVRFIDEWIDGVPVACGEVALFENVRFLPGETGNEQSLGRRMAQLCDVYVMDAFGSAHRAHASTCAVAGFAPISCAGLLLGREIESLNAALEQPRRPVVSIVGGAKVADKLPVLRRLAELSDNLIVGGGIANTFLAAAGHPIARSLHEPHLLDTAREIMAASDAKGCQIPLPSDVVVADAIDNAESTRNLQIDDVSGGDMIFDIGSDTRSAYRAMLLDAGTILWNGPAGVFERELFEKGTKAIARAVAESSAYSVAGGGDTLAALGKFGRIEDVSYICTGGGAFLDYVQGKTLPAIEALNQAQMRREAGRPALAQLS